VVIGHRPPLAAPRLAVLFQQVEAALRQPLGGADGRDVLEGLELAEQRALLRGGVEHPQRVRGLDRDHEVVEAPALAVGADRHAVLAALDRVDPHAEANVAELLRDARPEPLEAPADRERPARREPASRRQGSDHLGELHQVERGEIRVVEVPVACGRVIDAHRRTERA
jgi:hypothetical protein